MRENAVNFQRFPKEEVIAARRSGNSCNTIREDNGTDKNATRRIDPARAA